MSRPRPRRLFLSPPRLFRLCVALAVLCCSFEGVASESVSDDGPAVLSSPSPVAAASEAPSPLVAVMAPLEKGRGYLVRGTPSEVFPRMVEIVTADLPAVEESAWLESRGVAYRLARRDPVYARDYGAADLSSKIIIRTDFIESLEGNVIPFEIEDGQALVRGARPGTYCLVLPGLEPLAATLEVAGPVTLLRADAWEPVLFMYYISLLETFDESAFQAAMSPAPYAQIHPLIRRLRDSAPISSIELYLFYRGYYEALAHFRWAETAPDGRIRDFLERLRPSHAHIDHLVAEGLRRQELLTDFIPATTGGGATPPKPAPVHPTAHPIPATLERYKSFYHVGAASLFLSESQDLTLPRSEGTFLHPDEARLYAEQCLELGRLCARWANALHSENPLLPVLDGHFRFLANDP